MIELWTFMWHDQYFANETQVDNFWLNNLVSNSSWSVSKLSQLNKRVITEVGAHRCSKAVLKDS